MKKLFLSFATLALIVAGFYSCSKTDPAELIEQGLSADISAKITALGFDPTGAYAADGGFIVENDIFLSVEDLNKPMDLFQSLIFGNTEQYHTTNLVEGSRNISISISGRSTSNIDAAVDAAIVRYNLEGLKLTFSKVSSGGDINVRIVGGGNYIASAGFPSGGDPYPEVKFNRQYRNWDNATLTSVFAHEFGHCIGFRHTDYMDRYFSCGGSHYNEGDGGVGAIHIEGTPEGPDEASWMLSCIGNGDNRPFNNNDKTALNFLY